METSTTVGRVQQGVCSKYRAPEVHSILACCLVMQIYSSPMFTSSCLFAHRPADRRPGQPNNCSAKVCRVCVFVSAYIYRCAGDC